MLPLASLLVKSAEATASSSFNAVNNQTKGVMTAVAIRIVIKSAASDARPPNLFNNQTYAGQLT